MTTKSAWAAMLAVLTATLAAGIAACNKTGTRGLSVSAHAAANAGAATAAGLALADGITIDHVHLGVATVSVEGGDDWSCKPAQPAATPVVAKTSSETPAEAEQDDGCELSYGPFDVDLAGTALSGAVSFAFDAPIPDGTYEEVEIDLTNVTVDGLVDAGSTTQKSFSFSGPLDVTQKREGTIKVSPTSNVTLDFDPTHWFDGPTGRLDPTSTDPASRDAILSNIRASLRLVKDDDHDGMDDELDHP